MASGVIARIVQRYESEMANGHEKFQQWWQRWQQPENQIAVAEIHVPTPRRCHVSSNADGPAVTPVSENTAITTEEEAVVKKSA